MKNRLFLQTQVVQVRQLLEQATDDPILRPQLEQRLQRLEAELSSVEPQPSSLFLPEHPRLPRIALFLRGGGVQGSDGIRPSLAGEAMIQYEKMFTEQALLDERQAARDAGRQRRPRNATRPGLLFTGTPRGSFGLEFVPQPSADLNLTEVHAQSLKHVAQALLGVTEKDESLDETVGRISPGLLRPMKRFLSVLAQHGAELRLAFSDTPSRVIGIDRIRSAAERLNREVEDEEQKIQGVFRGLTRESTIFDLITDDGRLITGTIDESLTEEDLDRIDELTNRHCIARIQTTTVRPVSGPERRTFLLLDAKGAEI